MKNPQATVRDEMLGRDGDLCEIVPCVDAQKNKVVGGT
jgi:hypothetical protein